MAAEGAALHPVLFRQPRLLAFARRAAHRPLPHPRGRAPRALPRATPPACPIPRPPSRRCSSSASYTHHVHRQVAPRPPAAVPAHQPRLRRLLRHPLQQRHESPRCCCTTRRSWSRQADAGDADAALHRAGGAASSSAPRTRRSSSTCPTPTRTSRWQRPPRFRGKSPFGLYGDVIEELDWSVGEVLAALKKHGLDHNTLVMFSSDNGPWYQGSPGRLRGRKGSHLRRRRARAVHRPLPGRHPAGDRSADGVAGTIDILPTVAKLCGRAATAEPARRHRHLAAAHRQRASVDRARPCSTSTTGTCSARAGANGSCTSRATTASLRPGAAPAGASTCRSRSPSSTTSNPTPTRATTPPPRTRRSSPA